MENDFLGHLSELRRCLLKIGLAVMFGFLLSLIPSKKILDLIISPAGKLVFIHPAEALIAQMKVALVSGVLLSLPITLWQAGRFFGPALYPRERKILYLLLPLVFLLFGTGLVFGYLVVARLGYKFLLSFSTDSLNPMITLHTYLSFNLTSMLICALVFTLPAVVIILARLGIVKSNLLWKKQRLLIIGLMSLIAVLTPTVDVLTLIVVFLPLLFLMEVTVFIVWWMEKNKKSRTARG